MKKLNVAVALAIALPGVAHAQAAPSERPKMECCEKMKDKCACCDKMAGKPADGSPAASSDPHAGHDMAPGASPADGHAPH
jgi:hypothetical protein